MPAVVKRLRLLQGSFGGVHRHNWDGCPWGHCSSRRLLLKLSSSMCNPATSERMVCDICIASTRVKGAASATLHDVAECATLLLSIPSSSK